MHLTYKIMSFASKPPLFLCLLGGLHVEMAALKAHGKVLTGSAWVKTLTEASTSESKIH